MILRVICMVGETQLREDEWGEPYQAFELAATQEFQVSSTGMDIWGKGIRKESTAQFLAALDRLKALTGADSARIAVPATSPEKPGPHE